MIRRFWYTLRSVTALILRTIARLLVESGERKGREAPEVDGGHSVFGPSVVERINRGKRSRVRGDGIG